MFTKLPGALEQSVLYYLAFGPRQNSWKYSIWHRHQINYVRVVIIINGQAASEWSRQHSSHISQGC